MASVRSIPARTLSAHEMKVENTRRGVEPNPDPSVTRGIEMQGPQPGKKSRLNPEALTAEQKAELMLLREMQMQQEELRVPDTKKRQKKSEPLDVQIERVEAGDEVDLTGSGMEATNTAEPTPENTSTPSVEQKIEETQAVVAEQVLKAVGTNPLDVDTNKVVEAAQAQVIAPAPTPATVEAAGAELSPTPVPAGAISRVKDLERAAAQHQHQIEITPAPGD